MHSLDEGSPWKKSYKAYFETELVDNSGCRATARFRDVSSDNNTHDVSRNRHLRTPSSLALPSSLYETESILFRRIAAFFTEKKRRARIEI